MMYQNFWSPMQSALSYQGAFGGQSAMPFQQANLAAQQSSLPLQLAWSGQPQIGQGFASQGIGMQGIQSGQAAFPMTAIPTRNVVTYSFNPAAAAFQSGVYGMPMFNAYNPALAWNQQSQISSAGLTGTIQSSTGMAQPRIELAETNSDIVVSCELPNVNLNDLNLTVTDDSLTITATAFAGGGATSLHRTIALPTTVRSEHCDASYSNGILEARLPKSDVATRRRVKVTG